MWPWPGSEVSWKKPCLRPDLKAEQEQLPRELPLWLLGFFRAVDVALKKTPPKKTQLIFGFWPFILQSYQTHLALAAYFIDSLRFSMFTVMSSLNREFFSFLTVHRTFISFSCLIALARTAHKMLDRSGKSIYPCLSHNLGVRISLEHSHQTCFERETFPRSLSGEEYNSYPLTTMSKET